LSIPQMQKEELRSWYLRHYSLYKIVEVDKNCTDAINLVNNDTYRIREAAPSCPRSHIFKPKMIILGGLVQWRGEWYWSGMQHNFTSCSPEEIVNVLNKLKKNTQIVCRFWKEHEEVTLKLLGEEYKRQIGNYKSDLVVFPNGRAWDQAETKRMAAYMKSIGRMGQMPQFSRPDHLLDANDGIGMFFDTIEGTEIMEGFTYIISGLKKKGVSCSPEECDAIHEWITCKSISPAFIKRALKEYGGENSIKKSFCLDTDEPYFLEYLLRSYKGIFFRRRFPCLLVDFDYEE
ncbi:MAG: hypothetical protein ACRC2T_07700, partial [Thermoguttaceae bacterium]